MRSQTEENERRSRLFSSSFSSSSLTSSSYSYRALSFSRVFWSNFVSKRQGKPLNGKVCCASFCMCDYCIVLRAFGRVMMTMMTMMCVKFHPRIASLLGEDSCCRGGIVNIRGDFSRALLVWRQSFKALWRLRASTSNSLSGRTRLHSNKPIRYIDQTYAQKGIRVCEDDPFEPPMRQSKNPKAL